MTSAYVFAVAVLVVALCLAVLWMWEPKPNKLLAERQEWLNEIERLRALAEVERLREEWRSRYEAERKDHEGPP